MSSCNSFKPQWVFPQLITSHNFMQLWLSTTGCVICLLFFVTIFFLCQLVSSCLCGLLLSV
uniref:Uncharacterized protein n=1 Tax=Anguilla anguilla TaxID=7936 RepID=A0A0E9WV22_ANGAN